MTERNDRERIDQALAGASTTREVVIGPGAVHGVGALARASYVDREMMIVADERTYGIAGQAVRSSLEEAGCTVIEPTVFPGTPTLRPDTRHVQRIREAARDSTLLVAVGSGTINDLTKRAAFEAGVPYIVAATAASMDGYTASGAALISDGVKQTFDCPAPEMVIADLDIISAAPAEMTASGYGDLVGKVSAGADWILADALGLEPIIPEIWSMVQEPLRDMIAGPERFFRGEHAAVAQLFEGLVITGLAIQAAGTTRPASGSEHQFSHLWEMRGLEYAGEPVSHGMKVGLGSIVSTSIYEWLLDYPMHKLDVDHVVKAWPSWSQMEAFIKATHDHPMLVEKALEECRAKYLEPPELHERLTLLKSVWSTLQDRMRGQLLPIADLRDLLERGYCPTRPVQIGLTLDSMRESYIAAGQIRRRYTVFDIAGETGLLPQLVEEIFSERGYWRTAEGAMRR